MTWIQPVIGHHRERGVVCLVLRAMPFREVIGHYDMPPTLARQMAEALRESAAEAEGSLRIKVRRKAFDPFYHYECPDHPDAGKGTYQDAAFAADAARKHYEQEHAS